MFSRFRVLALLALTAGVYLSCNRTKDNPVQPIPEVPPAPNNLSVVSPGEDWLRLNWHSSATNEDGFYVYWLVNNAWQRFDTTFAASQPENVYGTVLGLRPGSTYYFRVTAFNSVGESDSSNIASGHTLGTLPPLPPINVQADTMGFNTVRVTWTITDTVNSFRVGRRQPSTPWMDIGIASSWDTTFIDTSAEALTTYWYRVGSVRSTLIVWCADSAFVTTPDAPPLPPDSVTVQAFPGVGVRITWLDRSENELGFRIGRSSNGQAFVIIDSVGATVTEYFDSLGNAPGTYVYRIQAYNAVGSSRWVNGTSFYYGLCSNGVIPLCVDNWWKYGVYDTANSYTFYRNVRDLQLIGGTDYYLITQSLSLSGPDDTLYYLRNFSDGCRLLDFPPPNPPSPALLFRYPATINPNQWSYVDGDCVIVAGTNVTATISGVTYTDLYVYQRFYADTHSVQIYVEPVSLGIVREKEFVHDNPVVRRDLIDSYVQSH